MTVSSKQKKGYAYVKQRQIRKELAKSIRTVLRKRTFPITFRDYQRETLESTVRWLELPRGSRAAYVAHATGLGKTVLFATLVSEAKSLNCLVVVPNKLLVAQTVREIVKLTNHAIGHVSSLGKIHDLDGEEIVAMRGHNGHRIVVTTDQSFKMRASKLAEEFGPHLIVRDECHWSYTEKSQDAVELFPEAVGIGYSATPDYLTTTAKASYIPVTLDNGQTLYAPPDRVAQAYYPELIDRRTVRWGIENEYLAPLAWGLLEFDVSLDDVPVTETPAGMDYDPEELRRAIAEHWPFMEETIVRLYEDNVYDIRHRQVCAMCIGVAEAESLAKKIARYVPSACITGTTKDDVRDDALRSFDVDVPTKETIRFISSVFVLKEGWDARNAEIALMLRPTKSRVLYEQFLGRILRLRRDGRDKIALCLDAHFLRTRLAPLSAPVLYGQPGDEVAEGGILMGPRKRGRKITSPYLPKNIRPKLRVVEAVQIEYWAGEDGFITIDGEEWGTIRALSKLLQASDRTIAGYIPGCRSKPGRVRTGLEVTFYAVKDVQKAYSIRTEGVVKANKEGFLQTEGREWGMIVALGRRFKLTRKLIADRVAKLEKRNGLDFKGHLCTFYPTTEAKEACADLLKKMLQANTEGFAKEEGEWWATIYAFARRFKLQYGAVSTRTDGCRVRTGKTQNGVVRPFYALTDLNRACRDLLKKVSKAGADGFFKWKGLVWGSTAALARKLRLSQTAIMNRINHCRKRRGRVGGFITTFYALKDMEAACADLIAKKKR